MIYSRRHTRIKQIVSLVLLAYAAADLFVPGICRTDYVPPSLSSAANVDASHGPENPGPANPYFDDCFCCCSHIALPFLSRSEGIFAREQFSILKGARLLEGVRLRPFNPPRVNQV